MAVAALQCSSATAGAAAMFGSYGSEAGQFSEPHGIAIDQEADTVYLFDTLNERIDKFSADGRFLLAWGWGVADGKTKALQTCETTCFAGLEGSQAGQFGVYSGGVAVDNGPLSASHGDVYVVDFGNHRVEKFDSSGHFLLMFGGGVNEETHGNVCLAGQQCTAGSAGSGPGEFEFASEGGSVIAVGDTGTVYIVDGVRVEKFSPAGEFEGQITLGEAPAAASGLAVNSTGEMYALFAMNERSGEVRRYSASGETLEVLDGSGAPKALSLNAEGDVFIDDAAEGENHRLLEFGTTGVEISSFDEGMEDGSRGIALDDAANAVYVLNENTSGRVPVAHVRVAEVPPPGPVIVPGSEMAEQIGTTTVTLAAVVNPEGAATRYRFEYGTSAAYGASVPVPEGELGAAFEGNRIEAALRGLHVATTYHFRIVVTNAAGTNYGVDSTFTTLPPALIEHESVADVTSTSATLQATINPLGSDTKYHFVYGPTTATACEGESGGLLEGVDCRIPVPDSDIGSGTTGVSVAQRVVGLMPGALYHYRAVAENALGTESGGEQTFVTQGAGGALQLPDDRAWEMVSPADKHGSRIEAFPESPTEASASGSAMTYAAVVPTGTNPEGNAISDQVLSHRSAAGWRSEDIALPHPEAPGLVGGLGLGEEYRFFSEDLAHAVVQPLGPFNPALSHEASEQTPYLRTDYLNGKIEEPCVPTSMACYRPLVTSAPGYANVESGVRFGAEEPCNKCGPLFVGGTADLSEMLLSSAVALTPDASGTFARGEGLYAWSSGRLSPVSVLPKHEREGATVPGVVGTVIHVGAAVSASGQPQINEARNAITGNGSRIVWSPWEETGVGLYVRDLKRSETVRLDDFTRGGGSGGGRELPIFQLASRDGNTVIFTDEQRLTAGSGASEGSSDLYACELVVRSELECELHDLTPATHSGEAASVQSTVLGASEDAASIYFVATGVLAEGAQPGAPNLYLLSEGKTKLVAVLASADSPDWNPCCGLAGLTARVSRDGRWLAFMSQQPLTGYDNRDAVSGKPDEELFLYDAHADHLVCASCDPSGARPVGVESHGKGDTSLALGPQGVWPPGTWIAANVPAWTPYELNVALFQPRYLSDSGRLFFDSADALVPQDSNGSEDVYEYEPLGIGNCNSSRAGYSERVGGCVGLISSGSSSGESIFLDASEDGKDVFFLTPGKLLSQDEDTSLDVYDAHECTSQSPCVQPVSSGAPLECASVDACRGVPSFETEPLEAAASQSSSGRGNVPPPPTSKPLTRAEKLTKALKACRRLRSRRHRKSCERAARARYGAKHVKRSRSEKGGSR